MLEAMKAVTPIILLLCSGYQLLGTFSFVTDELPKSRVIVLTDMLNEPDDSQTMVRLLMYSNEMDVEGLIAVSSCHQYAGKNDEDIVRNDVQPQAIVERIKAYGLIRENLLQHDDDWPTEEYLLGVVGRGPSGYGMWDVGDGHSTSGSEIIINSLLKNDPRPVYICINAGANTLAQAIWDLKTRVDSDTFEACLSKIRVYDDAGQDNAGAWIAKTYPQIHYRRSQLQVFNFMNGNGPVTWEPQLEPGEGQHLWAMQNVMIGHGVLGALYPIRKQWQRNMKWHTIEGGGTSTWIGHVNRGLWHPEQLGWGGWGGRFETEKALNVRADQLKWADLVETEEEYFPNYMYPQAVDHWVDPQTGIHYEELGAPIFRWRRAYQNDFEARMDWCVSDFLEANHNPTAVLNGDDSDAFVFVKSEAGLWLEFDASLSRDPDGDDLSYRWFVYPEAGNVSQPIELSGANTSRVRVRLPETQRSENEFHLILEVKDNGSPQLSDYRRVIVSY